MTKSFLEAEDILEESRDEAGEVAREGRATNYTRKNHWEIGDIIEET